jgi:hypothetical protein
VTGSGDGLLKDTSIAHSAQMERASSGTKESPPYMFGGP